jgi:hypothetical protein
MINLVEMKLTLAEAHALGRILHVALDPKTGALPHVPLEDQGHGGKIDLRLKMLTEEAASAKLRGLHGTVTRIVDGVIRTESLGPVQTSAGKEEQPQW